MWWGQGGGCGVLWVYLSLGGRHSPFLTLEPSCPYWRFQGSADMALSPQLAPCPVSPCSIFPLRPDAGGYGYLKHESIYCPRSPNACLSRRYIFVIKQVQHLWSNYCIPALCWRCIVAVQHLWGIYCMPAVCWRYSVTVEHLWNIYCMPAVC